MSEALEELIGISIIITAVGINFGLFFHGWPKFIVINKYYNDVDKKKEAGK